jgi:hypothetical protein
MGTKPRSSRQKTGRKSLGPGVGAKKAKDRKTRPHSISLADLFLWVRVVDECLYHPIGGLDRAAITEGYRSVGNVTQRLDVLERHFGKLLYRSGPYRSGVLTFRGAALAELFVTIELLYSRASSTGKSGLLDELHDLKKVILRLAPKDARRARDESDHQPRIKAALIWHSRKLKTGSAHDRKKMSDWPPLGPSPVKPHARHSPTSAPSSDRRRN